MQRVLAEVCALCESTVATDEYAVGLPDASSRVEAARKQVAELCQGVLTEGAAA